MIEHDAIAAGLLRAHVAHRAEHVAGARKLQVGLKQGEAKIGDPQMPALIEQ